MLRRIAAALAVAFVLATPARAALDEDDAAPRLIDSRMLMELRTRASRMGTSASATDTTFVGYTPGAPGAGGANYWSIYAGSGNEGYYRLVNGQPHKGVWDWEEAVQGDSLQGWWPLVTLYSTTGGITLPDRNRPWWAIDIGNQANYRGNQANGRTFGVHGVWHRDGGSLVPGPVLSPLWTPPSGAHAAWMGLRAHGDATHLDPLTGNAFNEDVLMFTGFNASSPGGNDQGFPGYGSQMDQMLYRDISLAGNLGASLTVRFKFQTAMSTGFGTSTTTRTGWFDCCPLGVTAGVTLPANQRNNFISSTDATDTFAPRDSFMVYIGRGVEPSDTWTDPTGASHTVYDPQRRWFGEVLKWDRDPGSNPANPQPLYYRELLSVAGNWPVTSASVDTTFVIPNAVLVPLLGDSARVRLVFRVKTNRGFDDQGTTYSSGRKGAAVVDRVGYRIGAGSEVVFGEFENAADLDNAQSVSPLAAWKSTGRPTAILDHVHLFSDLAYEDLCGQKGDLSRVCNMSGVVISSGDHDLGEAAGGLVPGTAEREVNATIVSPTICLADDDGNPNTKNLHGLYGLGGNGGVGDVGADDYLLTYELYTGAMDLFTQGSGWIIGGMAYPGNAKAGYGYPAWGQMRFAATGPFNDPTKECFGTSETLDGFSLLRTSNPSGIPDSIRIILRRTQQCFRFGVTAGCSPTDGVYWDNVALAIVDGAYPKVSVSIWDWYNDAFPANGDPSLPGVAAAFDTTAALIKNGYNTVPGSYTTTTRHCVPGDSVIVQGNYPVTQRVDMVFRILPGPGNYDPIGRPDLGTLRRLPTSAATVTKGDGSFWDEYRQAPGDFASTNAVALHHNAAGGWDPNVWNSARCDTSEWSLAALQGRGIPGGPFDTGNWRSTLHESDPHFFTLGILKNICYVRCLACATTDIRCDGGQPVDYAVVTGPGGTPGTTTTKEHTKVIPDGLLTPGSHVEYFFRSQDQVAPGPSAGVIPDTNAVYPQEMEGSTDAHRWQEFSILPNRWKDPAYRHPVTREFGAGPACMLVVDLADRRGNERVWVSIADTIGATPRRYWGAHNGWHAVGGGDLNDPAANRRGSDGMPGFVPEHLGQAGSGGTWDLFQAKANEGPLTAAGTIGSRYSYLGGSPLLANKSSRQGPSLEMLNAYYSMMLLLSGDLSNGILGPYNGRSQNDAGLLIQWLAAGSTTTPNRALWAMGDGFVTAMSQAGYATQYDLIYSYLGVALMSPQYSAFTGNTEELIRLRRWSGWNGDPYEHLYGVRNICDWSNDVLLADGNGYSYGGIAAQYEARAGGASAGASVYTRWDPANPWMSLTDGFDIENLSSDGDHNTVGRSSYFLDTFTKFFASICGVAGTPLVPLDVPNALAAGGLTEFMRVTNNPVVHGRAVVRFGVARADRVEARLYDVSGRRVRTLSDRMFGAGEHALTWDGLDDAGHRMSRGVYFARMRYASSGFEDAKKVVVLRE